MSIKDKLTAQNIFLIFSALFITSLVVSNLIFKKFFYWYPFDVEIFGSKLFEISVGIQDGLLVISLNLKPNEMLMFIYSEKTTNIKKNTFLLIY